MASNVIGNSSVLALLHWIFDGSPAQASREHVLMIECTDGGLVEAGMGLGLGIVATMMHWQA